MAEDSLTPKCIHVCKDLRGEISLLTQRGLEEKIKAGRGLTITARVGPEGGGSREVTYEGFEFSPFPDSIALISKTMRGAACPPRSP